MDFRGQGSQAMMGLGVRPKGPREGDSCEWQRDSSSSIRDMGDAVISLTAVSGSQRDFPIKVSK